MTGDSAVEIDPRTISTRLFMPVGAICRVLLMVFLSFFLCLVFQVSHGIGVFNFDDIFRFMGTRFGFFSSVLLFGLLTLGQFGSTMST